MRAFTDDDDVRWEAVVGRESWGAFFAIFIPRGPGPAIRQTALEAASYEEATRELEALDGDGLTDLFQRSEPKDIGRT